MYKYQTKVLLLSSNGILKYHLMVIYNEPQWKRSNYVLIWPHIMLLNVLRIRFYTVEIYLKKINCTFCGNSTETFEHIFITCSHLLSMRNQLSTQIYNTTSKRIGLYISKVIYWDCPLLDTNMVVNFLI